MLLNPPYDHDDQKRRLEHAFLTSLTRALCPGGLLVFIIPQAGVERAPPDLHDNIMAACRSSLADFKVPREIRFVDEMPRSTLEKVAKAELRKLL